MDSPDNPTNFDSAQAHLAYTIAQRQKHFEPANDERRRPASNLSASFPTQYTAASLTGTSTRPTRYLDLQMMTPPQHPPISHTATAREEPPQNSFGHSNHHSITMPTPPPPHRFRQISVAQSQSEDPNRRSINSQPATQHPRVLREIHGLFAPEMDAPGVVVTGELPSLRHLVDACEQGLMVDSQDASSAGEAFERSLQSLEEGGAFPSEDEMRMLFDAPRHEQLAGGLDMEEDFCIHPNQSVARCCIPPLQESGREIDCALAYLRVGSCHCGQCRSYGLVILSHCGGRYGTQTFSCFPDSTPTHFVFLYRRIEEVTFSSRWHESWRPFVRRPGVHAPQEELSPRFPVRLTAKARGALAEAVMNGLADYGSEANSRILSGQIEYLPEDFGKFKSGASINPPAETRPTSPTMGSMRLLRRRNDDYTTDPLPDMTATDALGGDIHPTDIDGAIILRIAMEFTNQEIHQHLSRAMRHLNMPEVSYNTITKRVTNSLHKKAKKLTPPGSEASATYNQLRKQFDQEREVALTAVGKTGKGGAATLRSRRMLLGEASTRGGIQDNLGSIEEVDEDADMSLGGGTGRAGSTCFDR